MLLKSIYFKLDDSESLWQKQFQYLQTILYRFELLSQAFSIVFMKILPFEDGNDGVFIPLPNKLLEQAVSTFEQQYLHEDDTSYLWQKLDRV